MNQNQNEVIESLVLARRSLRGEDLSLLSAGALDGIGVEFYHKSVECGFLTRLNVAIQEHGTLEPGTDRVVWRSPASDSSEIIAGYNIKLSVTEVFKGSTLVFSNVEAGREFCNPGQWMRDVWFTIGRLEEEKRRRAEAADRLRREQRIRDLTAEV